MTASLTLVFQPMHTAKASTEETLEKRLASESSQSSQGSQKHKLSLNPPLSQDLLKSHHYNLLECKLPTIAIMHDTEIAASRILPVANSSTRNARNLNRFVGACQLNYRGYAQ